MFSVAMACSFTFNNKLMLLVATPPNASAFSYGRVKIIGMVSDVIYVNPM